MRNTAKWVGVLLLLAAGPLSAAPCTPGATTLCLNASRFEVEVAWRDSRGRTGVGQAVSITADTGYFWFFSEANIELVVKVLDARSINQKYWVFFGALSAVEYDLIVTDTTNNRSKTYHNPLGQFASVGDTSAFDPSAISPVSVTVTAEGAALPPASFEAVQAFIAQASVAPSAAAFTPCPETVFGFNLTGCRFHVEVSWRDSRGREGVGQPVQLTNDTGYFWFFSPANVELMVKVLDARSVNGKFWVFFGALSSVEFTLAVTDTVTGDVKTYRNPLSTFASVGDTSAFVGGYAVAPVRDAAHSTSADLDEAGGTIVAHGTDGTTFTLEIPPDALNGPETITLTPVSHVDRLPFSGGLIAGVELEPERLRLMVPATLTIEPAVLPAPPNLTVTYAYGQGGENLMLYPRLLDTDAVALPILHFSGYGAGSGTAADAASQAEQTPSGPLAPYVQNYGHYLGQMVWGLIDRATLAEFGVEIFTNAYNEVIVRLLDEAKESCDKEAVKLAMNTAFEFLRFIQLYGFAEDIRMNWMTAAVFETADQILRTCQQKAYDRCVNLTDPFEIVNMLDIARQLQLLGDEDPYLTTFIQDGLMESCLRFEIDFESKIVYEFTHVSHGRTLTTVTRQKYRAQTVPLRFNYAGNAYGRSVWEGTCSLVPEAVDIQLPVDLAGSGCTLTINPGRSTFEAAAAWIGVMDDPSASAVKLLYEPGAPVVDATLSCPNSAPSPFPVFQFEAFYQTLHLREQSGSYGPSVYVAGQWDQLRFGPGPSQNGEFFAKKGFERTVPAGGATLTEETWFFLKHTPGKAMPACN